jgi:hypothetical protein
MMWDPNDPLYLGIDVDPRQVFKLVGTADDDVWQRRKDREDIAARVKRDMEEYRSRAFDKERYVVKTWDAGGGPTVIVNGGEIKRGDPVTISENVAGNNALLSAMKSAGHARVVDDDTEEREAVKWISALFSGFLIGGTLSAILYDLVLCRVP